MFIAIPYLRLRLPLCGGTVSVSVVGNLTAPAFVRRDPIHFRSPFDLSNHRSAGRLCLYRKWHPLLRVPSGATQKVQAKPQTVAAVLVLNFVRRRAQPRELTLKFSGFVAGLFGDSSHFLGVDSIEGHNQVSGKGFPTTGPWIEAGSVVIHRGLHVSNVTASCSLCAIRCKELFTDRHRCPDVLYVVVMLMGYVVNWNCVSFGITRLICASFGITRLICASFGITRLICASFGITRLIGVSFGVTRLIRSSFGITRLICKGTARGRPMRGKKDA
ncbi:hypothetical protein E6C27_scaffold89G002640 [Cucumis melo var. makuwa]|uniref:Uncharacterized protein n=1 Tax=Cucumis melo var. makuwa TaxID=1194695 RepID=A0A5A7V8F2_CUCMM|nr:hypothetical protein E6C27_scaffold89G002640 [Cucumis melo var. makuwa]